MNNLDNQIVLGDCLEILEKIPANTFDMVLCDLPYGTTQNKWDNVIDLERLWHQYNRVAKKNAAIALTAQTPFDKVLGVSNLKNLRYEIIWEKEKGTGFLNAKKMPLKNHENVLVFYRELPTYNPQFEKGKPYKCKQGRNSSNYNKDSSIEVLTINDGFRYPKSVWKIPRDNDKLHPTQKPVALFEKLIKSYTNEGDLVLDNCIGSGTTAIACLNTKRRFFGIEKDEGYYNMTLERIKNYEHL